jgi:hypothetical protein
VKLSLEETILGPAATFLAASQGSTSLYDNAWFIGISTGLASGAIIAIVTPLFLRRRRARDLAIRRERAADDTLSTLRPAVASGTLPSGPVVEAIARAADSRRGLDPKLATPITALMDQLISEIMSSAFLAPDARLQLANRLLSLRSELDREPVIKHAQDSRGNYKLTTIATSVVGALAFGAASALSAYLKTWVPLAIISGVAVLGIIFTQAGDRISRLGFGGASIEFARPVMSYNALAEAVEFIDTSQANTDPKDRVTGNGTASRSSNSEPPATTT